VPSVVRDRLRQASIENLRSQLFPPRVLSLRSLIAAAFGLSVLSCGGGSTVSTGGAGGSGAAGASGSAGRGGATGAAGTTGNTGTTGRAGTTGTSGLAGTTGSTGAAGTTGTTGVAGTSGSGCTGCALQVLAECQTGTSKQEIKVYLALTNEKSATIDLTQLTLRYWFTSDDPTTTPTLAVDYAQAPFSSSGVSGTFVPLSPAVTGANEYLEVAFSSGSLGLFSTSGVLELRMSNYATQTWDIDQTDDYSFRACAAGQTAYDSPFDGQAWNHLTAYVGGKLIYGTEPQ
jgi:Cellulose binding domain/Collagen triple helix repeat (20 copies)